MKIREFHEPVRPDTYEASMALNQIMKIGKHAIKLHKLIDDSAEMEAWVQKKIDLAGDYVKKVHGYMQGQDSGLYDDNGLTEDGPPFGSGMELLRMAIMRKFITVQEWDLLKHKWNDAADEVEQKYADWPEGEGFGSSDHNFAIKDLMTAVGYEFDDQDTSGRFVVTKVPDELEKAGITNARMKGEPVATEERQEGFAVRYSLDGVRKVQAYKTEKDAQHRAKILRSMGGVKDVSITTHTLNFKKESAYESKLATMLNQRLK